MSDKGWECPVCGTGNAPSVKTCEHSVNVSPLKYFMGIPPFQYGPGDTYPPFIETMCYPVFTKK